MASYIPVPDPVTPAWLSAVLGQSGLLADYQSGLIYWLLVPLQDRFDGSPKSYWWPKMQCLVAAFREWYCADLLGLARS